MHTIIKNKKRAEIEIGDSKQNVFYPQFKTKHWDNECNFSARLIDDINGATYTDIDGVVEWKGKDKRARFYDIDDENFEFEVIFDKKPTNNRVRFSISTKRLWFSKQPKNGLANEYIPENVKGSYAVYHSGKKGNIRSGDSLTEYKTGKAFHIYRPEVIDADGNRAWCKMNIDFKKDILIVDMPQHFIDNASYPITLDPTYGYTSIGGSEVTVSADEYISVFIRTVGQTEKTYIYAKGSGSVKYYWYTTADGEFKDDTNNVSLPGSYAWTSYTLPTPLEIGDVNLHFAVKGNTSFQIRYDYEEKNGSDNWRFSNYRVNPFTYITYLGSYDWSNRKLSMYGEYSDYGAYFVNNTQVVIDGSYRNLSVKESGTFEPENNDWIEDNILDTGLIPVDEMPAIMAVKLRDDNYMVVNGSRGTVSDGTGQYVPWSKLHSSKGFSYTSENASFIDEDYSPPPSNWPDGWPWNETDDSVLYTTDYAVFTNSAGSSTPDYGMEIYDAAGEKIFNSEERQMIVVGAYDLVQMPNYGSEDPSDMTAYTQTVDDSDNYFFAGAGNGYCIPLATVGYNYIRQYSSSGGGFQDQATIELLRRIYVCAFKKINPTQVSYKWILKGVQTSQVGWINIRVDSRNEALTYIYESYNTCGFGYSHNAYSLGNGVLFEAKVV